MRKQLQSELSHEEQSLSSPSPERLHAWRLFFESALALLDVLDAELEQTAGIPQRWYDVLVHLEESPQGVPMNELADQILYSKSGFTRVVDRMEDAGLIRRLPDPNDRRGTIVEPTERGLSIWDKTVGAQARREALFSSVLTDTEKERLHDLLRNLMQAFPDWKHKKHALHETATAHEPSGAGSGSRRSASRVIRRTLSSSGVHRKRSGWRKPSGSGSKRTKTMDRPSGIQRGMVGSTPSRAPKVWRTLRGRGRVSSAGTSSGSRSRISRRRSSHSF